MLSIVNIIMMFLQMVWDDTTRIGCGVANNEQEREGIAVLIYLKRFNHHQLKTSDLYWVLSET